MRPDLDLRAALRAESTSRTESTRRPATPAANAAGRAPPPGPSAVIVGAVSETSDSDPDELGQGAEFVDDAIDDDEVSPEEKLLLDRKELHELGLDLDNPEGFADE